MGNGVADWGASGGNDVEVEATESCGKVGVGKGFDALDSGNSVCMGSAGASAAGHGCQAPPGPGKPGNVGIGCKGWGSC